jgi:hypothetical protein
MFYYFFQLFIVLSLHNRSTQLVEKECLALSRLKSLQGCLTLWPTTDTKQECQSLVRGDQTACPFEFSSARMLNRHLVRLYWKKFEFYFYRAKTLRLLWNILQPDIYKNCTHLIWHLINTAGYWSKLWHFEMQDIKLQLPGKYVGINDQ